MRPARGPRRVLWLSTGSQYPTATNWEKSARGGRNDVAILEWARQLASSNQAGCVGYVTHQPSLLLICGRTESLVVPVTRVCRCTADDESRFEDLRSFVDAFIVDELGLRHERVRQRLEVDSGRGDLLFGGIVTMGQMATIRQAETHQAVLRLEECRESREVGGLGLGVRRGTFDFVSETLTLPEYGCTFTPQICEW
jgi:hypothetical protein